MSAAEKQEEDMEHGEGPRDSREAGENRRYSKHGSRERALQRERTNASRGWATMLAMMGHGTGKTDAGEVAEVQQSIHHTHNPRMQTGGSGWDPAAASVRGGHGHNDTRSRYRLVRTAMETRTMAPCEAGDAG